MFYLIVSFILLLVSVYMGIAISEVSNYVLITYDHWVIESSLWVALLVILIVFIFCYLILRLVGKSLRIGRHYRLWKKSYRERRAQVLTQSGLCQLAEGQWKKAEEQLIKAAKLSRKPLIRYLGAASAANARHLFDKRDSYLRLAHNNDRQAAVAIGLTQARLQLDSEQWEQALSTLQHLNQVSPHHGYILKLLLEVNVRLRQWEMAYDLLQPVKKYKALSHKAYEKYADDICFAMLKKMSKTGLDQLQVFWQSLAKTQRDERFTVAYVDGLIHYQQDELAMQLIVAYMKRHWSSALIQQFSRLSCNVDKQIRLAENWLVQHPQDAGLLLTLGKLCIRQQLWGKAKDYLLRSIQQVPSIAAYTELANVYRSLNERDKIEACYRNALQLT